MDDLGSMSGSFNPCKVTTRNSSLEILHAPKTLNSAQNSLNVLYYLLGYSYPFQFYDAGLYSSIRRMKKDNERRN